MHHPIPIPGGSSHVVSLSPARDVCFPCPRPEDRAEEICFSATGSAKRARLSGSHRSADLRVRCVAGFPNLRSAWHQAVGRFGNRRLARSLPLARRCRPCLRFAQAIPFAASQAAQVSRLEICATTPASRAPEVQLPVAEVGACCQTRPSGRASVRASPDSLGVPKMFRLAGTLALPSNGLGNAPYSRSALSTLRSSATEDGRTPHLER